MFLIVILVILESKYKINCQDVFEIPYLQVHNMDGSSEFRIFGPTFHIKLPLKS